MNFQRRTFRAPDEPCESDNELNGCRKSLKIEFRQQETTNTQNLDESTGCTKRIKKRPRRASRPRQEHSKSTHRASKLSQELRKSTRGASRQMLDRKALSRSSEDQRLRGSSDHRIIGSEDQSIRGSERERERESERPPTDLRTPKTQNPEPGSRRQPTQQHKRAHTNTHMSNRSILKSSMRTEPQRITRARASANQACARATIRRPRVRQAHRHKNHAIDPERSPERRPSIPRCPEVKSGIPKPTSGHLKVEILIRPLDTSKRQF